MILEIAINKYRSFKNTSIIFTNKSGNKILNKSIILGESLYLINDVFFNLIDPSNLDLPFLDSDSVCFFLSDKKVKSEEVYNYIIEDKNFKRFYKNGKLVKKEKDLNIGEVYLSDIMVFDSEDINSNINEVDVSSVFFKELKSSFSLVEGDTKSLILCALYAKILKYLKQGKTIILKNFGYYLHWNFIEYWLEQFSSKLNKGQIIFSSNNTNLLPYFKEEEIWFVDSNQNSKPDYEFISLLEYKNVSDKTKWQKGYQLGRYGGVPFIDKFYFGNVLNQFLK